jgi:hypothetical protein
MRAMENLYSCRKAHGNAAVRIGVMGKGTMPYYRVIFAAFFNNHTPLEWTTTEANNKSRSTSFMTFEEVKDLRSKVRTNHGRKSI